ncbi:glycoside hydrolase 5 family protein [Asticcacaulis tiandongensis]|uniref:glycoside hydrolase 5 family protein n=1 Tax=Asticcacaulis tiandongensis TaxID=2565365 RepID=UPI0011299F28|nr:cellulase family glycosylhydrolase [Asticcacaulis tiandongensis]
MTFSLSRRTALLSTLSLAALAATGCSTKADNKASKSTGFITVEGPHFKLNGETYRFVGANIWYGAYLGAEAAFGNRERLHQELDTLKALGVTNLRVLASSELSPLNNSLDPAFRTKENGNYNNDLLTGLDYLMAEMAKRDMKAVLYLTNFWEWSGGMVAYMDYVTGKYINNGDPNHPWPAFAKFSSQFYANAEAVALYHDYVRFLVSRTNSITGKAYADDPTLMAWQLSNEPRQGGDEVDAAANSAAYLKWIKDTADLIRSLDKNHLVSLGHEGTMGAVGSEQYVIDAHEHIDYLTAHIWPQNWSWVDGKDLPGTFDAGMEKVQAYIDQHIALAVKLNKPLTFEEFGFPRDDVKYEPGTPTVWKDKFYAMIYKAVEDAVKTGGPVAGSNFWAWGGSGRALNADYHMKRGETAYMGDPPHEPQGWYSVFNTDTSTQELIKNHAAAIAGIS